MKTHIAEVSQSAVYVTKTVVKSEQQKIVCLFVLSSNLNIKQFIQVKGIPIDRPFVLVLVLLYYQSIYYDS